MPSVKNIANAFKQAASALGPGSYEIDSKTITCPHCGNDVFARGEAQLNTSLMTFFKLDWLDASSTVLICTRCSQIQWFGKQPLRNPAAE